MKVIYWPFQGSVSVLLVSRLPYLYCHDVPYSFVVAGRVKVDLSALLWVLFPCVYCHFLIFCPLTEEYLIVSIPNLCCLPYNRYLCRSIRSCCLFYM